MSLAGAGCGGSCSSPQRHPLVWCSGGIRLQLSIANRTSNLDHVHLETSSSFSSMSRCHCPWVTRVPSVAARTRKHRMVDASSSCRAPEGKRWRRVWCMGRHLTSGMNILMSTSLGYPQMTPSLLTSLGDYWDHDRFQFADEATGGGLETGLTVVVSCPLKPVYLDQAWAAISSWSTLREAKNISFEHCPCPRLSCSCWVLTSVTRRPVVTCHSHSHSPLPARALSPAPAILTWILGIPKQADKPP